MNTRATIFLVPTWWYLAYGTVSIPDTSIVSVVMVHIASLVATDFKKPVLSKIGPVALRFSTVETSSGAHGGRPPEAKFFWIDGMMTSRRDVVSGTVKSRMLLPIFCKPSAVINAPA